MARITIAETLKQGLVSGSELAAMLSDVAQLAFQPEQDQHGLVRPSYHAYKHCMNLLLSVARKGEFFQPAGVSTDPNAAIRVVWIHEGKETELVCPSEEDELPSVYHSYHDEYGDEEASPETLLARIGWMMDADYD